MVSIHDTCDSGTVRILRITVLHSNTSTLHVNRQTSFNVILSQFQKAIMFMCKQGFFLRTEKNNFARYLFYTTNDAYVQIKT